MKAEGTQPRTETATEVSHASSDELRPGIGDRLLDQYEIFGQRGGANARILFVRDPASGARYAVKALDALEASEETCAEIEFWLRLPLHPNILRPLSVRRDGNRLLVFMDYEAGGSLRDVLETAKQGRTVGGKLLPATRALRFATQLCDGMMAASVDGEVAHLDLKPENLLVGSEDSLRIADFGLSYQVQPSQAGHYPRQEGATWTYAAPERFRDEVGDTRSDIFSAGLILYEMLTGTLPYPIELGPDPRQRRRLLQDFHAQGGMKPITDRLELVGIPGVADNRLGRILSGCLDRHQSERFPSFKELRERLEAVSPVVDPVRPKGPATATSARLDVAIGLQELGRHAEALRVLNRILAKTPADGRAYLVAARSLWSEGSHSLARSFLSKAVIHDPGLAAEVDQLRRSLAPGEYI